MRNAAKWLANRHQAYTKFMKNVVIHITEAYIIHKQLDELSQDDMDKNDNRVYYQALQYPDEASLQKIKTVAHLGHYQKFIKDDVSAMHIHSFIENLSVKKSVENNRPITWLELFILYRLRGYKKPIDDPKDISHVRATMDKQMNTFKTKVRAIVSRIYANSQQAGLFAPDKIKNENLIGIGIIGKHQGPSFNVKVTDDEKYQIAVNLHLLNHTLSLTKIDKIIKGQTKFIPRPLIMRGRADWIHNINKLCDPQLVNYEEWKEHILKNENWNSRNQKAILLKCSKCGKIDPHYILKPSMFDVDNNLKCRHCGKQSMSKHWTCPCGDKWYLCNTHKWCAVDGPNQKPKCDDNIRPHKVPKIIPDGIKNHKNDPNEKPSKSQKTHHGETTVGEGDPNLMVTHQQMLKDELKHESEKCQHPKNTRPKGDITLDSSGVVTKRPRVLGQKLSVRFGTELSSLANKDGTNKAIQHQGELVRKRSCENTLIPTKKPRGDGDFHPSEHGNTSNHAASSSNSL